MPEGHPGSLDSAAGLVAVDHQAGVLLPEDLSLDAAEAAFASASRASSTLRGYRSDWTEFVTWCRDNHHIALPATDIAISRYISALATAGAKVGTISRRLSTIRFAHKVRNHPDPTQTARVIAVWEGIRRQLGAPPDQARPLMPPLLLDVVDACPAMTKWKTRDDEPSLSGIRDRVLLLVGFVSALRASELAALEVDQIKPHERGLVIELTRSKTNQTGDLELVVLPWGARQDYCPVTALRHWLTAAGITEGLVFRSVSKGNRVSARGLTPDGLSRLITQAVTRAGLDATGFSAHSLRAGFVTYAAKRGATSLQIARQTRHKDLASIGIYTRIEDAWEENAATQLPL